MEKDDEIIHIGLTLLLRKMSTVYQKQERYGKWSTLSKISVQTYTTANWSSLVLTGLARVVGNEQSVWNGGIIQLEGKGTEPKIEIFLQWL